MGGRLDPIVRFSAKHSRPRLSSGFELIPMRVFLRNRKTRLYCTGSNEWADSEGQALDFASVPQAARFAFDEDLPEAEIVLKFHILPEEVALPVLPEWCNLDQPHSAAA
jgi:hypothetical protein